MNSSTSRARLAEADLLFNAYVGRQCIRVLTDLGYLVRLPKKRGRPPATGSNEKDEETLRMARIGRSVRGVINPVVRGEDSP